MRRLRLIPAWAAEVISPKCSLVRLASSIPLRLAQSLSRGGGRARRRAELDDEPLPLGSQPCEHLAGAAGGQAVPAQRRLLAGEIAHLGERDDQALGFVACRCSRTAGADRDAAVPAGRYWLSMPAGGVAYLLFRRRYHQARYRVVATV
jgi:hypothetical protein